MKMDKKEEKKDKKSLKHVGPILEVSSAKSSEKKQQKKTVVAASVAPAPVQPAPDCQPVAPESPSTTKIEGGVALCVDNNSFIICSHIAEQVDIDTLKSIAKKYGVDLEHTREEQKAIDKELKKKIKAWKKCPCRMDFRNVCRDPTTGETCATVRAFMTPQPYEPRTLEVSTRLPPGTIGVGRRQVAFHTGGPLPNTNDPHALELGRRDDGTMCVSVQYSPDPRPLPEYICTTVRETQAAIEGADASRGKKSKSKKGSKGKKGKK